LRTFGAVRFVAILLLGSITAPSSRGSRILSRGPNCWHWGYLIKPSGCPIESWKNRRESWMLMAGERWYVACSLQRQEAKAELNLLRQGFRAFSPRMTKTVRRARKLRGVRGAAFPSYMFVLLDLDRDLWRSINGTFGVASLMARERPQAGPFGVVEQLLDCAGDDGLLRFDRDFAGGTSCARGRRTLRERGWLLGAAQRHRPGASFVGHYGRQSAYVFGSIFAPGGVKLVAAF
jgi:hypothetical protein